MRTLKRHMKKTQAKPIKKSEYFSEGRGEERKRKERRGEERIAENRREEKRREMNPVIDDIY